MKKRFVAFYDMLFFAIMAGIMLTIAINIFISGDFGNIAWMLEYWYLTLVWATCIAVPFTTMFSLQKIIIDLNCDKLEAFYLVNFEKNDRDLHSNWVIHPSEIESIEIVKLSKEEKRRYTSARFLFGKYLKVNYKYGHAKYLYVSHYSKYQIQKMVKLLTMKN